MRYTLRRGKGGRRVSGGCRSVAAGGGHGLAGGGGRRAAGTGWPVVAAARVCAPARASGGPRKGTTATHVLAESGSGTVSGRLPPRACGPAAKIDTIGGGGGVWATGGVRGTLHILWGWRSRGCDSRSDVGAHPRNAVRHHSDDRVYPCRI